MEKTIKLIAVVGPTASGKSGLAISLARALNGEVVSCDSMQIYQGLEIGTAKVSPKEMQGIPHHLLGIIPREQSFSVSDYLPLAETAVAEIAQRERLPIIAGGTGLYARSLLYGVKFEEGTRDSQLRLQLETALQEGRGAQLYARLEALDPQAAQRIHPNNEKRLVRALEYCLVTGKAFSQHSVIAPNTPRYPFLMLGIGFRDRARLYSQIDSRVEQMMDAGLLEEARSLYRQADTCSGTLLQAIGYKEFFSYFSGSCTLEAAVENLKRETRRYAKRQLTWFQKEASITWLYADDYPGAGALARQALALAKDFIFSQREGTP